MIGQKSASRTRLGMAWHVAGTRGGAFFETAPRNAKNANAGGQDAEIRELGGGLGGVGGVWDFLWMGWEE